MATTTQLSSVEIDLHDYAGEYGEDYDMDAIHADYVALLNEKAPEGVYIATHGDVFAKVDVLDTLDEDWRDALACSDDEIAAIFERHDISKRRTGWVAATVKLDDERAGWLAANPVLAGNDVRAETQGPFVLLSQEAIDALSALEGDDDGLIEGDIMWFGGTDYQVTR